MTVGEVAGVTVLDGVGLAERVAAGARLGTATVAGVDAVFALPLDAGALVTAVPFCHICGSVSAFILTWIYLPFASVASAGSGISLPFIVKRAKAAFNFK